MKLFEFSNEKSEKQIICNYYNKYAPDYDVSDEWYSYYYNNLKNILFDLFGNNSLEKKRVLDIGCGTGIFTEIFSVLNANVTGIDIAENMINIANFRLSKENLSGKCIKGDAENIPFTNNYFDVVFCCGDVLDYIEDDINALSEMHRVLKPGGLILIGVGNRIHLGVIWYFLSYLFPKKIKYNLKISEIGKMMFNCLQNKYINFPHINNNGNIEYIPLRSYSYNEIKDHFLHLGIKIKIYFGFHIVTGLIPYTLTSNKKCNPTIRTITRLLIELDKRFIDKIPFNRFGAHLLFIGEKVTFNS